MNEEELVVKTKYLLEKYLVEDRASSILEDFEKAQKEGRSIGKEVLHILSTEKKMEFDDSDRDLLKEVAFNMGL
jgi:hypothetical protein